MERIEAFRSRCDERGLTSCKTVNTDYTQEAGRRATLQLLAGAERPSAIIYDNEVLTAGGVLAVQEVELAFPDDIGIASFEDAPVCQFIRPQITALERDPAQLGAQAALLLVERLAGSSEDHVLAEPPRLVVRGSSASTLLAT